jgi:hypothetical protein
VLNNQCLVEFNESYCEILHNGKEEGSSGSVQNLFPFSRNGKDGSLLRSI